MGAVLAPTTRVVGATVLTIGLLALPSMLGAGYDHRLASGIVCCAGTLCTVLPPSIILIMLSGAMRDAQSATGAITLNFKQIDLGMPLPVALLFVSALRARKAVTA